MSTKEVRRPPKGWRRNMATSALLLLLLDAIIVSPSPDTTRLTIAIAVAAAVLIAIAAIWRRNIRLERVPVLVAKDKKTRR